MLTLSKLDRWLTGAPENEHLAFKEAKQRYDTTSTRCACYLPFWA
jgi:ATP-dependent DNA helicase RecG